MSKSSAGPARCIACRRTISKNKRFCLACATFGEECGRAFLSPSALASSGQVLVYECLKCHRSSYCVTADPGLTPYMMNCRALGEGEGRCNGASYRSNTFNKHDKRAPLPLWEFHRPRGLDLEQTEPGMRELIGMGLLDLREIRGMLIQSSR